MVNKNKSKATIIMMMLVISMVFTLTTLPISTADDFNNSCPEISDISIANQSTNVGLNVGYWNVTISDIDNDTTNGTIECNSIAKTYWFDLGNGTRSLSLPILDWNTSYTIWLNLTDGTCFINNTYWFITQALDTSVNNITSYWIDSVPEINVYATVNDGIADNITLYYRWSSDNSSWHKLDDMVWCK